MDRAAAKCDLIVTHPLAFAGSLVAQKRSLPWASSVLAPMSLMSCMDPPLIGPAPWLKSLRVLAITATQALGCRAILLTGVPPAQIGKLPPSVQAFEYLPYSAVFPHAAAVIHQAGIGTLAQALAAGQPQLIVPVAFDQPDNAQRAAALGVAGVLPFKKVKAKKLAEALQPLLSDRAYTARAAEVAATIAGENPSGTACDCLEALLR